MEELLEEDVKNFLSFEEKLCKRLAYIGNKLKQIECRSYHSDTLSYSYEDDYTGSGDFEYELQTDGKVFIGEGHDSDCCCNRRATVFSQEFIYSEEAIDNHIAYLQEKLNREAEARFNNMREEKLDREAREYELYLELKDKFEK